VGFPPPPPNREHDERAIDPPTTYKRTLKGYFMVNFDFKVTAKIRR
jgi:hypothetical protein